MPHYIFGDKRKVPPLKYAYYRNGLLLIKQLLVACSIPSVGWQKTLNGWNVISRKTLLFEVLKLVKVLQNADTVRSNLLISATINHIDIVLTKFNCSWMLFTTSMQSHWKLGKSANWLLKNRDQMLLIAITHLVQ